MSIANTRIAMVTTSLSWMIMVIIGAFFIIFGYSIVQNYQDIEEEKFDLRLQLALNHIFTLIGQSTGSEASSLQKLNNIFENKEVTIYCREQLPTLSIDNKENPNSQFLKNYPVYMTHIEQEKVEQSYVAVQNFDLPFRITPLLAIVSKRNLYVIDSSNEDFAQKFRDKFSRYSAFNELNFEFVDFSQHEELDTLLQRVKEENLNSISLISDSSYDDSHLDQFLDEVPFYGTYIQVNSEEFTVRDQTHENGTITYINATDSSMSLPQTYNYIDWNEAFALPTMALFSKPEVFDCSYLILQDTINQTYYYYQKKAEELKNIETKVCRSDVSLLDQKRRYEDVEKALNDTRYDETFMNLKDIFSLDTLITRHNAVVDESCVYLY